MITRTDQQAHRHPIYWFDDGSVIVRAYQADDQVLFKIHERLFCRHSRAVLQRESGDDYDVPTLTIPPTLGVHVQDLTSLLAHLYHDTPLVPDAPFTHVAALLRVTAPDRLDFPAVHQRARTCFVDMFPGGPLPFVHPGSGDLEEALGLAVRYGIDSVQKGIYYSLVTTTDFETPSELESDVVPDRGQDQPEDEDEDENTRSKPVRLTPTDVERCRRLLTALVEHFTPVLFEPPVTPHMACTNVLAEKWFPLVTQHAIGSDSVYKPLEALERLKGIDWAGEGVCGECVIEKREEWTGEQAEVWERMDGWLALG